MNTHDLGYTKLFSHARMVRDLLVGFVREDWVSGLDFSTLEKVNQVYVTDDFRKRLDDLVWKIRWHGMGLWLYIYLILEPQSTVDDIMALRNDLYLKLFYQDLRQSGKIPVGQKFPPVVSIVLYNGKSPWTAAMDVADLIEEFPPGLEVYCPRMRYMLVDEHRYQIDGLKSMQNVVAALFRLEKSRTLADVRQVVQELDDWLQIPEQRDLRRAFANWLGRILLPRLSKQNPAIPESIPEMNDLKEVHTMLAETVEEWTREWELEGHKKGHKEGHKEGLQDGAAAMLLKLLHRKFGQIAESVSKQVTGADQEIIESWGENVLFANSLEEVFNATPKAPDSN